MGTLPGKIIALSVCALFCFPLSASAQASSKPLLDGPLVEEAPLHQLFHTPPKLPEPAHTLQLAVSTSALKKGSYRIESIITRDGKSFPAAFDSISTNVLGRNAYIFTVSAPEKEIRYQFFLRDGENNTLAQSSEYTLTRTCLKETLPPIESATNERERVEQLATAAHTLEIEIEQLHAAFRLTEDLKGKIDEK